MFKFLKKIFRKNSIQKNYVGGNITADKIDIGDKIFNNYKDYNELLQEIEETQEDIVHAINSERKKRKKEKLYKLLQRKKNIEKEILSIVKRMEENKYDTERLIKVEQLIQQGKINEANNLLDRKELANEQSLLLKEKKELDEGSNKVNRLLENNAEEYITKAKLTSIDYKNQNRIKETKNYYRKAIKACPKDKYYYAFGSFLTTNGFYNEAETCFDLALKKLLVPENLDFSTLLDISDIFNGLGATYNNLSRSTEAIKCLEKSVHIKKEVAKYSKSDEKDLNISVTLNTLAFVYIELGKNDIAESYLKESIDLSKRIKNPDFWEEEQLARGYDYLGMSKLSQKLFKEAQKLFNKSLPIRLKLVKKYKNKSEYLFDLPMTYNSLGSAFFGLGKNIKAKEAWIEALKHTTELFKTNPEKFSLDLAIRLINLAEVSLHLKDKIKSKEYAQKARDILTSIQSEDPRAKIYSKMINRYLK